MALEFLKDNTSEGDYDKLIKDLVASDQELKTSQSLFQNQDMVKLVNTYLEEEIPEDLKAKPIVKEFWAVLGKTVKLTFLDKEDLMDFEMLFDQTRIDYIMSKPPYDYTFEDQQVLDQLRLYFLAAIKRSIGFAGHRFNERIILGGSINQVIRSNTESFKGGDSGGGIFSKLKSIF